MTEAASDRFSDPSMLHDYLHKLVLVVRLYGLLSAMPWGRLCGIATGSRQRRPQGPSAPHTPAESSRQAGERDNKYAIALYAIVI